jgi:hypothetical protein
MLDRTVNFKSEPELEKDQSFDNPFLYMYVTALGQISVFSFNVFMFELSDSIFI